MEGQCTDCQGSNKLESEVRSNRPEKKITIQQHLAPTR